MSLPQYKLKRFWNELFRRRVARVALLYTAGAWIQSEISRAILEAVHVKLIQHHATRQPTDDFEAYHLYLLGRHHFHRRTESSLNRALEYFKKAIAIDEAFSLAYSGLADAACLLSTGFYGDLRAQEAVALAMPAAQRALEIDPDSAEGHASMGLIHHTQEDYEAANRALERAIGINRNYALAHVWLGMTLITQGRYREAAMRNAEALRLDPLSPIANANAGFDALRFGEDKQAETRFGYAIELDSAFAVPYSGLGRLHSRRGNLDEALVWVQRAIDRAPTRAYYLGRKGFLYLQLGQIARAAEWLDAARQNPSSSRFLSDAGLAVSIAADDRAHLQQVIDGAAPFDPSQRGLAAWLLNDPDRALAFYEEGFPAHAALILNMVNDDWLWRFPHSLNRAHLRLRHGDGKARDDLVQLLALLADARNSGLVYAETHYWTAAVLVILERHDEALTHLDAAIRKGWRNLWWAKRDPNLAALARTSEFAKLMTQVEKNIAQSVEKIERGHRG